MSAPLSGSDTDPVTTANQLDPVQAAYDMIAAEYAAHFTSTEPEQAVDLGRIDHFAGRLGGSRTVLDAGCGGGEWRATSLTVAARSKASTSRLE